MALKKGKVYCDKCGCRMQALSEDECLEDSETHGWTDYMTAEVHFCEECHREIFENWEPPCYKCYSHRCHRGIECWASPPAQQQLPYETYYAHRLSWRTWFERLKWKWIGWKQARQTRRMVDRDDIPF